MNIKKKIILLALLGFMCFSALSALVFYTTIDPTFHSIERDAAKENMDRITQSIGTELEYLGTTCKDWAAYDDSYEFMSTLSPEYIENNLGTETFDINNLDLIYYYDPQGKLVWGENYNAATSQWQDTPLITKTPDALLGPFLLQGLEQAEVGIFSGSNAIFSTHQGPMLISAYPILSSELKGPARGVLMMGRLLDSDLVDLFQSRTRVPFTIEPYISPSWNSRAFTTQITELSHQGLQLKKSMANTAGSPVLTILMPFERTICSAGIKSMLIAMSATLALGLAMTLAMLFTVNRLVVNPVQHLTQNLIEIRTRNQYSRRVEFPKANGLATLFSEFNNLLEVVDKQNSDLSKTNEALKRDLMKRRDAEKQLSEVNTRLLSQSRTDGLTRLANRRMFDEHLEQSWARLKREKVVMSLIMCDVDYFKRYNDSYGHQAGDDCLKKVARILKISARRPDDLVARYGGEEFVILLPGASGQDAMVIAERIRMNIADLRIAHEGSDVSHHVSISMGISSVIPSEAIQAKELVEQADMALYQAKSDGRNRVVLRPCHSAAPPTYLYT